jgi:hypothetical protein
VQENVTTPVSQQPTTILNPVDNKSLFEVKTKPSVVQTVQTVPEIAPKKELKYRELLLKASENYYRTVRVIVKGISEKREFNSVTEKIMLELNESMSQLQEEKDIPPTVLKVNKILKEFKANKKDDLFIFAVDFFYKRLFIKCKGYKNEDKRNFVKFAMLSSAVIKEFDIASDCFLQIMSYRCPYIIPKIFKKVDFSNPKELRKRLGFADEDESLEALYSNMECYALVYFNVLLLDSNRYLPIILEFLDALEDTPIEYPMVCIFKIYIYLCGKLLKEKKLFDRLENLAKKYNESIDKWKNTKGITGETKAYVSANGRFIKKYINNIKLNKNVDA